MLFYKKKKKNDLIIYDNLSSSLYIYIHNIYKLKNIFYIILFI